MTNQSEAVAAPLSLELFEPEIGSIFAISFIDARFELRLREATALKYRVADIHARAPFALLFVCPDQRVLEQGTYAMEHARLGDLEVFVVPTAADEDGVHYEAVFN